MQKYSVNQHLIETILSWVKSGEIEIQYSFSSTPNSVCSENSEFNLKF